MPTQVWTIFYTRAPSKTTLELFSVVLEQYEPMLIFNKEMQDALEIVYPPSAMHVTY